MIQVFCISTSLYNAYAKGFLDSLHNFFPMDEKVVTICTDEPEKYKELDLGDNIKMDVKEIVHLPYPMINMAKPSYLKKYILNSAEYVCYFDIDTMFIEKDENFWTNFKHVMDGHICVTSSVIYNCSFFPDAYRESDRPYLMYDRDICNILFNERKTSELYDDVGIPDPTWVWAQTSMICSSKDNMTLFSDEWEDFGARIVRRDKSDGQRRYIFPRYYDESIVNRMAYDACVKGGKLKFMIKPYATNIPEPFRIKDFTFVYQKFKSELKTHD